MAVRSVNSAQQWGRFWALQVLISQRPRLKFRLPQNFDRKPRIKVKPIFWCFGAFSKLFQKWTFSENWKLSKNLTTRKRKENLFKMNPNPMSKSKTEEDNKLLFLFFLANLQLLRSVLRRSGMSLGTGSKAWPKSQTYNKCGKYLQKASMKVQTFLGPHC